jgi:tetratricopeptide (TPR) repeat protein
LGNPLQASALFNKDFSFGDLTAKPNALDTAKRLNELGYIYYRQGRLEDACTVYQWALSSAEAATGKDSTMVAACLSDYANVLNSLGRTAEAQQMKIRATVITARAPAVPELR